MANGPVIRGAWSRCRIHKTLLEPDEQECLKCRILRRNLSLKPPFDVVCIHPENNPKPTQVGEVYTVIWVIKEGSKRVGELQGYGLKAEGSDTLVNHCYDPDNFIPEEFLDDNNTDKWDSARKVPDPKEKEDPNYDPGFFYG